MLKSALVLFVLTCICSPAQAQSQLDDQRKRLAELNVAIQELDRKIAETNVQRNALEAERSRILNTIAVEQAKRDYENPLGYVVSRIDGNSDITLLVNGQEKTVHLYGLLILRHSESQAYLRDRLVKGVAYIRCTDRDCRWVYLYDQVGAQSLNAQLVQQGHAMVLDPSSLDESKHVPTETDGSAAKRVSSASSSSPIQTQSGKSSKPQPGTDVHVSGYTRKDGTYVPPHTRSAPKKKP